MLQRLALDGLISLMDTGLLYLFLTLFLPPKAAGPQRRIGAVLMLLAVHLCYSFSMIGVMPFRVGLFFCFDLAFCFLLFRGKPYKFVICILLNYILMAGLEAAMLTMLNLVSSLEALTMMEDDYSLRAFICLIIIRLMALAFILFIKAFKKYSAPKRQWIMLLPLSVLTAGFVWMIYSRYWSMQNEQINALLMMFAVFLVIQNLLIFAYIAMSQGSTERYYQIKNIYEQKSQYNSTIATFKRSMHKMGHDLRHHFVYLAGALERDDIEKAKEYLAGLDGRLTELTSVEVTGHMDVDAILYHKQMEAEEAGVHLRVQGSLPPNLPISAVDLSVALGNALDNAIRGAASVEGVRDVLLSLHFNNGRLYIMVSNPYTGTLRRSPTGKLLSTKLGSGGLGVESIADVVKRNDGHMTVQTDNQQFILTLLLQAKNQD